MSKTEAGANAKERILAAATKMAQAHGYGGLNFRDLAADVGIKAASIYYHFTNKADLGAAVARRYTENAAAALDALLAEAGDPQRALRRYPETFRKALEADNRICLGSFLAAETADLPEEVNKEVRAFGDMNIAWLNKALLAAGTVGPEASERRARAIFAAVAGAQLVARSRADPAVYDSLIEGYREAGLL